MGELLIQDISRSGAKLGFNLTAVSEIFKESRIPIICSGGAKDVPSLLDPFSMGASGVGVSTIFSTSSRGNSPLISYISIEERALFERGSH
jgi:imidazole glycerol phosphate synthase subunit HisF